MTHKLCRDCDTHKPIGEFYKNERSNDGLMSYCIPCTKIRSSAQRIGKKRKRKRKTTPLSPEKLEQHRKSNELRQQRLQTNGEYDPSINVKDLYIRDKAHCHICKNPVLPSQASIDHVIPVAKGGPHVWSNVKLAHKSCNTSKRDRHHV